MSQKEIDFLRATALSELKDNILPWWIANMPDSKFGGMAGRIDGNGNIISDAPKGGILNARILWTYSAAYNLLKDIPYIKAANYIYFYAKEHFFDRQYGGTYWSLAAEGQPLDTKKQVYSVAFFIYALSEYFLAIGHSNAKKQAIELFGLIEKYSFDKKFNGYLEAFDQQWNLLDDLRLSAKDANEKKTMNTHLHVLEAYTNLYRIWHDPLLKQKLHNLVQIFLDHIVDKNSHHLNLFFDEQWNCRSAITSYGHDIEASWLLYEAADVLKDKDLTEKVKKISLQIAEAATEGLNGDGSLAYELDTASGHCDRDRHWWVQAEAVVGFYNAYELSHDEKFLNLSSACLLYIMDNLVDRQHGEWFWSIRSDGTVNRDDDKAGFWKCPYHNSRMCMEIIRRLYKAYLLTLFSRNP